MNRFELVRAQSAAQAKELVAAKAGAVYKAGGIDLLDHLKEHLVEPPRLVDLKTIPGLDKITVEGDGSLRIGALATLAKVAAHEGVRKSHPALARACGEAASPQIRNVATLGGNVLQRPRCWYYRLESYKCIKKGGDTCYAIAGENRYHVIFGGGPAFPPHPSNAAVPLVAYGASFVLDGPKGPRTVPAAEFFVLPAQDPTRENVLQPGELLVEVKVPAARGWKSAYYEVRERQAFDWPLVSAAIAIKAEGGVVKDARVVLGQVAPVPWRSAAAEKALVGKPVGAASAEAARQGGRRGGAADDRQRLQGRPGHDAGAPHGRHTRVRGAMNANEAPENVGVTKETAETPVCRRLRTKMYYVLGREAVNLRESSPTAQYWCSLTATVMGPDDMPCSPEGCQPDRGCFEPSE